MGDNGIISFKAESSAVGRCYVMPMLTPQEHRKAAEDFLLLAKNTSNLNDSYKTLCAEIAIAHAMLASLGVNNGPNT